MQYQIPIIITVDAVDEFHKNKQITEFLRSCYREFAAPYNVLDYEVLDHMTKVK